MTMAKIGLLLDRATAELHWKYGMNVFETYYAELLGYAGIPFTQLSDRAAAEAYEPDILILAKEADDEATEDYIRRYLESGGIVISFGGLRYLAAEFGFCELPARDSGYAVVDGIADGMPPLRYLTANPWVPLAMTMKTTADDAPGKSANIGGTTNAGLHADVSSEGADVNDNGTATTTTGTVFCSAGALTRTRPGGEAYAALLVRCAVGRGLLCRWSINVAETIVSLQQGTQPIVRDGLPAPDGSAPLDDRLLKAEDGIELSWEYDRLVSSRGTPYFAYPYADLWRNTVITHLLHTAVEHRLCLPFKGLWPDGIGPVATISLDSDGNRDDQAETALEVLSEADIRSTWCMLEPGYGTDIYERVSAAGHELAFHYNALHTDGKAWGRDEFVRQFSFMRSATGVDKFTANKNHYTRFEGWGELYEWCEFTGIEMDQTRGPSKRGNVGFTFDTCHPFFPIARSNERNRIYNVLELCFLTQDLDISPRLADSSVIDPFLRAVRAVNGVAHFLFHQQWLHGTPAAARALLKVVADAEALGYTFWTAKQINDWSRWRRETRIVGIDDCGAPTLRTSAGNPHVHGALVVWLPQFEQQETGHVAADRSADVEVIYGLPCRKFLAAMPKS